MQPPYAPNVVNQTVSYGGQTWKGNPGQGWTLESATGNNGGNSNTAQTALDTMKAAQQFQVEQNQPAIATAQAAGTSLADQYKTLLNSVMAQGSATYNTATSGENAYLGARGLLSQSGLGNNEMSQAQNAVNTTNAVNQGGVMRDAASTQNQIAQYIGGLQAGNVPNAINFGANIANTQAGIINTNTQAGEALTAAQLAAARPFGVGNLVFNPSNNTFAVPRGGGGNPDVMSMALMEISKRQRKSMESMSQFVQPN